MNYSTQHFSFSPKWLWLLVFFPFLVAFMFAQTARAGGNDVAIEMIALQVEEQQVDVDGDGRLDTFSADFTVNADGTAYGHAYVNYNSRVVLDSGSIDVDPNGDLIVTVQGTDEHEIGHTLGFLHEHGSSNSNSSSNTVPVGVTYAVAAGNSNSFLVMVLLTIR